MKLTAKQIESCALGVIRVSEEEGLVRLHRFTPEQEQMYAELLARRKEASLAASDGDLEAVLEMEQKLKESRTLK